MAGERIEDKIPGASAVGMLQSSKSKRPVLTVQFRKSKCKYVGMRLAGVKHDLVQSSSVALSTIDLEFAYLC